MSRRNKSHPEVIILMLAMGVFVSMILLSQVEVKDRFFGGGAKTPVAHEDVARQPTLRYTRGTYTSKDGVVHDGQELEDYRYKAKADSYMPPTSPLTSDSSVQDETGVSDITDDTTGAVRQADQNAQTAGDGNPDQTGQTSAPYAGDDNQLAENSTHNPAQDQEQLTEEQRWVRQQFTGHRQPLPQPRPLATGSAINPNQIAPPVTLYLPTPRQRSAFAPAQVAYASPQPVPNTVPPGSRYYPAAPSVVSDRPAAGHSLPVPHYLPRPGAPHSSQISSVPQYAAPVAPAIATPAAPLMIASAALPQPHVPAPVNIRARDNSASLVNTRANIVNTRAVTPATANALSVPSQNIEVSAADFKNREVTSTPTVANSLTGSRFITQTQSRGISVPQTDDSISSMVTSFYGATFVADPSLKLPGKSMYDKPAESRAYQKTIPLKRFFTNGYTVSLQAPAANALIAAQKEAGTSHLKITPVGDIASLRSYEDTSYIWHKYLDKGLTFWVQRKKLTPAQAKAILASPPKKQLGQVLALEQKGLYLHANHKHSILNLCAPPGSSQHISGLALDVEEHQNAGVRAILNRHGWYQTVAHDFPHFIYLGRNASELPQLGLTAIRSEGRQFWVPDVPQGSAGAAK